MEKRNQRWNQRCKKLFLAVAAAFLLFPPLAAYAADAKILSTITYDDSIYVYIRGVSESQPSFEVQIGNTICQSGQLSLASLNSSGVLMRTLILIDNSKSISDKNHADIQEILEGLISSSMENEQFKIGTFSDQVSYLCDYSSNKEILSNVASTITYNNQDTYLSDVLHHVISELQSEKACAYTRIFVIADGADDNPKGWPSDEVRSYIGENPYPVYSVGIPGKNNSAELETMFSFSRASDAEYFLLDGNTSSADIVDAMAQDRNGICLKISPDESLKDGSVKSILLKLGTPEGVAELKTSVEMPFGSGILTPSDDDKDEEKEEKKEEKEDELAVLKQGGNAREEIVQKGETGKSQTVSWILIVVIAAIALLVAVGVVVFVLVGKKRKKTQKEKPAPPLPPLEDPYSDSGADTVLIEGMANGMEMDNTMRLWGEGNAYLALKRLDDTNVMYKVPMKKVVRIGRFRDQDIIINDEKVSKKHCEIHLNGDLLYIKDCNSRNGTKYEGVAVYDDEEKPIVSGGKIEIGAYSYCVELVKGQMGDKG